MSRLLLLLAVTCVGSAALFAQRALLEATPLAVAAWRLGLAAVFFLVWSFSSKARAVDHVPMTVRMKQRLTLAGVCLALHFLVWFASLQYIPIAESTLLVCTTPLWAALGGLALGRPATPRVFWIALTLAVIGVWLVTRAAAHAHTAWALRGDLLAVSGGMLIAVYLLCVDGLHAFLSVQRLVTTTYTVAALTLWAVLLSRGGVTIHYSMGTWSALLGMAVGSQILGHTLLNNSLRHFPSSTVAFALLLEPVIAAVLAWLLLRQTVTPGQIVGGLLVVLGLALIIARKKDSTDSVPAG